MGFKSKYKGKFSPKHPEKYLGNPTKIIFRSSYELKYMIYLDDHPDVIRWGSEEVIIPYIAPDGKSRRYIPDFIVQLRNKHGQIENLMVEIKPFAQTQPPKKPLRMTKGFLEAVETYEINKRKWHAAIQYCQKKGLEFKLLTESDLGIKI